MTKKQKNRNIVKFCLIALIISFTISVFQYNSSYNSNVESFFTTVSAQSIDGPGLRTVGRNAYNGISGEKDLDQLIVGITNFSLNFVTSVAILMLLYGGYLWIVDMGDDQSVEKAKKIIAGSIIGILLVIAAYTIVNTIVDFGDQGQQCDLAIRSGNQTSIAINCSDQTQAAIGMGAGLGSFIGSLFGIF